MRQPISIDLLSPLRSPLSGDETIYIDDGRHLNEAEPRLINTGRKKFLDFLRPAIPDDEYIKRPTVVDEYGNKKGVDYSRRTGERDAEQIESYDTPGGVGSTFMSVPSTASPLTNPAELSLWSTTWGDPLQAEFYGSRASANLTDDPAFTRASMSSYPQPNALLLSQYAAYEEARASGGAVAIPVEDQDGILAEIGKGAVSIATGNVSLADLKGEIAIILIGLVLLGLGIYAAVK